MNKIFTFLLVGLICGNFTFAEEEIFPPNETKRLQKRGNRILEILANGDILAVNMPGTGKDLTFRKLNLLTKKSAKIAVPMKTLQYIAIDQISSNIVTYNYQTGEYWHVDWKENQCSLIGKREKGKKGFDLYGERKSRLDYLGGQMYGWGYEYNKKMELVEDCIFKIKLPKKDEDVEGQKLFRKVIGYDKLKEIAKKYDPKHQQLGNLTFNGKYLVFKTIGKKDNPKSAARGKIIAVKISNKRPFVVNETAIASEVVLAPQGNKMAYITIEKRQGTLVVYDLQRKRVIKKLKGKLIRPRFNLKNNKIGVLEISIKNKKAKETFIVVNLNSRKQKKHKLKKVYIDWKFTPDDKHLILLDGKGVYKYDLK